MGIKSTQIITREEAIERISKIQNIILSENYLELEKETFEQEYDIEDFIKNYENIININTLNNYTNKMLENIIEEPFFRKSMFDNYDVV